MKFLKGLLLVYSCVQFFELTCLLNRSSGSAPPDPNEAIAAAYGPALKEYRFKLEDQQL